MRVALAAVFQLTNTFSRVPTTFNSFVAGAASPSAQQPCDPFRILTLISHITELFRESHVEVTSGPISIAPSSGPATQDCVAQLSSEISRVATESAATFDAFVLVLSGAMLDEGLQSVDRQLIEVTRKVLKPDVPLVVLLSSYANLSQEMAGSDTTDLTPDVILGFDPQRDGEANQVARSVVLACDQLIRGTFDQITHVRHVPLLVPPGTFLSHDEPLRGLRAIAAEFTADPDVLDVSLYPGFPYADVSSAGFGISVTASADKAPSLLQRLYRAVWDRREDFAMSPINVEIAVHGAMLVNPGPTVVAELGDDPVFGGCGDGTGLLWALIDLGAPNSALGVIVDPVCVASAIESGVGSRTKFDVGGGLDRRAGYPIQVTAAVRKIVDGHLMLVDGCAVNMGRSVLLDVAGRHGGQIDLIVSERAPELLSPSVFSALGVDISLKKIVGVKSSVRLEQYFGSIADTIIRTSTPGITTPVLRHFNYRHVRRPIYPIDAM